MSSCLMDVMFDINEVLSIVEEDVQLRHKIAEIKSLISRLPEGPAFLEDVEESSSSTSASSSSGGSSCSNEMICSVCMDSLQSSLIGRDKQLPCAHVFHENCITEWLLHDMSCPLCRKGVAVLSIMKE